MSLFNNAKILAEVAHLVSQVAHLASQTYGLLVDKSRASYERDQRIKALEAQIAELRSRLK